MIRAGIRTKLTVALAFVAAFVAFSSLLGVERFLAREVRERLGRDLSRSLEIYSSVYAERTLRRATEARLLAEEPRLKALVRTTEIDRATLEDAAEELRGLAGANLLLLTDRTGEVTASAAEIPWRTEKLTALPGVTDAARDGQSVALWVLADEQGKKGAYQVVLRALKFGVQPIGLLALGYRLDDALARSARSQIGSEIALLVEGEIAASAFRKGITARAEEALFEAASGLSEVEVEGERLLVERAAHPNAAASNVTLILARSLDEALAEHRTIRWVLAGIGGVALLLALMLAFGLATNLTRRIQALLRATEVLAGGDLSIRVPVGGHDEVSRLGSAFNAMAKEVERGRAEAIAREGLEREMRIARKIQTALLPSGNDVPGYQVAARMLPAEEVGGDYYDILAYGDVVWFAMGDVSSHGVTPGLIMMMAQSIVAAFTAENPNARPSEVFAALNRALHRNIHERLHDDNHMTLVLLRSNGPGRLLYAGAHLDIAIRRAKTGEIDTLPTIGTWAGIVPEVGELLEDRELALEVGDVMLLYTDGITEARAADGAMFEFEGLVQALRDSPHDPARVCDHVLGAAAAHMRVQDDDMTILAIQRVS